MDAQLTSAVAGANGGDCTVRLFARGTDRWPVMIVHSVAASGTFECRLQHDVLPEPLRALLLGSGPVGVLTRREVVVVTHSLVAARAHCDALSRLLDLHAAALSYAHEATTAIHDAVYGSVLGAAAARDEAVEHAARAVHATHGTLVNAVHNLAALRADYARGTTAPDAAVATEVEVLLDTCTPWSCLIDDTPCAVGGAVWNGDDGGDSDDTWTNLWWPAVDRDLCTPSLQEDARADFRSRGSLDDDDDDDDEGSYAAAPPCSPVNATSSAATSAGSDAQQWWCSHRRPVAVPCREAVCVFSPGTRNKVGFMRRIGASGTATPVARHNRWARARMLCTGAVLLRTQSGALLAPDGTGAYVALGVAPVAGPRR